MHPDASANTGFAERAAATTSLRAAVIGLGVGEQHVEGYRRHPGCTVTALCDVSPQRREEVARRWPDLPVTGDPDAILADPEIDVVSVASYDEAHGAQVVAALRNGKHVFVEKPLCLHRDEARAIRAALAERPDLKLASNLILRLSPRFRLVRRMVDDGVFGRIFHVEGEYNYGRIRKLTHGWRARGAYSVVLGGAVHLVDQLLWLTGRRVTEVAAFGNRITTAGTPFRHDDMVTALLRFDGGATGTVTANFGCVRPHNHGLAVYGTRATFLNDDPHGRLFTSRDAERPPQPITAPHPGTAKGDLIAGFVDSILGRGEAPVVDAEDVFAAISVCLAIEQAKRSGCPCPVEYL